MPSPVDFSPPRRSGVLVLELEDSPLEPGLAGQLSEASARLGPIATVTGQYHSLALSPDGRLLAAGTERGWRLLDAPALTRRAELEGGAVSQVAFSPDGARLAAAVSDWRAPCRRVPPGRTRALRTRLLSLDPGPEPLLLEGPQPQQLAWSDPDTLWAAEGETLRSWRLPRGRRWLRAWRPACAPGPEHPLPGPARALLPADGALLVLAGGALLRIQPGGAPTPLATLPGATEAARSPDGRWLAILCAGHSAKLSVWPADELLGPPVASLLLDRSQRWLPGLAFAGDRLWVGTRWAVLAWDFLQGDADARPLQLERPSASREPATLTPPLAALVDSSSRRSQPALGANQIRGISALTGDARGLYLCDSGLFRRLDARSGAPDSHQVPLQGDCAASAGPHPRLICRDLDRDILLWDLRAELAASERPLARLPGGASVIAGQHLVVQLEDGAFGRYRLEDGALEARGAPLFEPPRVARALTASPDGRCVIAINDRRLVALNAAELTPRWTREGALWWLSPVAAGERELARAEPGRIHILDLESGQPLRALPSPVRAPQLLRFTPHGLLVCGELIALLDPADGAVRRVPGLRRVLAASDEVLICLEGGEAPGEALVPEVWGGPEGVALRSLPEGRLLARRVHGGPIEAAALLPDGGFVTCGGGHLCLWPPPEEPPGAPVPDLQERCAQRLEDYRLSLLALSAADMDRLVSALRMDGPPAAPEDFEIGGEAAKQLARWHDGPVDLSARMAHGLVLVLPAVVAARPPDRPPMPGRFSRPVYLEGALQHRGADRFQELMDVRLVNLRSGEVITAPLITQSPDAMTWGSPAPPGPPPRPPEPPPGQWCAVYFSVDLQEMTGELEPGRYRLRLQHRLVDGLRTEPVEFQICG